jgi:hypothetical protein
MAIYLFIISYAIKDTNTIPLLVAYALACGAGNFCIMKWENNKFSIKNKFKRIISKHRKWVHNHLCIDCINKRRK